ncbi:MAG TPA: sulfocyanin-like copper-binding protein [Gemmatimonadales bacterium]
MALAKYLWSAALFLTPGVAWGQSDTAAAVPWMAVDSAARTVRLALEVTRPAGSPSAVINGYREGGVQIVVPLGWTVAWDWNSADSTTPHSLVVMAEREKLPTEGGRPAFINAMTRNLAAGLPPGQVDRTTFEADQPGWYWLLCGVPAHAIEGEWIGLRVDPEARGPAIKVRER